MIAIASYNPKINFKICKSLDLCYPLSQGYYDYRNVYDEKALPSNKTESKLLRTKHVLFIFVNSGFTIDSSNLSIDLLHSKYKKKALTNLLNQNENKEDYLYLLRTIIKNNIFYDKSYMFAILISNSILIRNGYLPIIYDYKKIEYITNAIKTDISDESLIKILNLFAEHTNKLNIKSEPLSSIELIKLILSKKEKLIELGVLHLKLYGSFVINKQNEYSDIDILIDSRKISKEEREQIKNVLSSLTKRMFDIHFLVDKSPIYLHSLSSSKEIF